MKDISSNVKPHNGSGSSYKNINIDEKKKLAEIVEFLNNHVKDPKLNRENGLDVDSMLSVIIEEGVHKNNDLWVKLKENIKPTNSKNDNKVELTPEGLENAINKLRQVPTRFFENTSFKRASKPPRQGKFSLT